MNFTEPGKKDCGSQSEAVEKSGKIRLGGKLYSCGQIVEILKKRVTSERLLKIQRVVNCRSKNLVTVMENVYDRGNTSAVMRSAEAFGFHLFYHIIGSDSFKEARRVTQGAEKWLIQFRHKKTEDCMESLKKKGYRIYVTDLKRGRPIDELCFNGPVALCFGNEKTGASQELINQAHEKVYIPMEGFVQSFNISVAAALCFQYIHGEHRKGKVSPLSDSERQYLLALYLYRSCGEPENI